MSRLILILITVLSISGCASSKLYMGDPLPEDRISVLERGDLAQRLVSVDAKNSINYFLVNRQVEILPGEHKILVGFGDGSRIGGDYPLVFTAKPGLKYVIKSDFINDRWAPSIVEKSTGKVVSSLPINLIPMYGYPEIEKSGKQKTADEEFIKAVVKESGSREQSARKFASWGWSEKRKSRILSATRKFNQSWLLDDSYYQSYWGFGAIYLERDEPKKAIVFFEKTLELVSDTEKARLQVDTAKAYALLASKEKKDSPTISGDMYRKANALIEAALEASPNYDKAYFVGVQVLYEQGNYSDAFSMVKKAHEYDYEFDPKFVEQLSSMITRP